MNGARIVICCALVSTIAIKLVHSFATPKCNFPGFIKDGKLFSPEYAPMCRIGETGFATFASKINVAPF